MLGSSKTISNMHELITEDNLKRLEEYEFTVEDYYKILNNISEHGERNLVIDENLSALDCIKNITKQHVNIYYSERVMSSGYYIYDKIFLNDKLPESEQIVTLIHELTHHIYADIFEFWLAKIFDVEDYKIIESFVMFMLNNAIENRVADEYLSYIVESRFTPKKYHNYLSFLHLLVELGIDVENSKGYFIFAHEISHDIDNILRPLFNEDLCKKIEEQFVIDDAKPYYQELTFDYRDERFDDAEKIMIMKEMIYFIFDYFLYGDGNIDELESYVDEFDEKIL